MLNHDFEKIQSIDDIIAVILGRMIYGFADVAKSAIMHDRFYRVGFKTQSQLIFIGNVSQYEMSPFAKLAMAVNEIVINDCFVSFLIQYFIGV